MLKSIIMHFLFNPASQSHIQMQKISPFMNVVLSGVDKVNVHYRHQQDRSGITATFHFILHLLSF